MAASNVVGFSESIGAMSFSEGLNFIERTRRQLDRFDTALRHSGDAPIDRQEAAALRRLCDALEADIRHSLASV